MESNRHECHEDVTVVSSPECILRDGRQIPTLWSAETLVEDPPIVSQSLQDAVEVVATLVPGAKG